MSSINKKLDNFENTDPSSSRKGGPTIDGPSNASEASTVAGELREREKRSLNVVFAGDITEKKVEQFVQAAKATNPVKYSRSKKC